MNKIVSTLLMTLFPALALAADSSSGSLSFAPPPSDYSVVFLGNIFGIVDGVLHGSGSQIMGSMFSVFNSAVLALGGIVIMYTLLVSTMNTAQEGQMLGQKWSSIWVPVRSTLGLALLIPKASGYCLMQIFVMWVVLQGVGAADKVWEAALSYLNRGGVIVQTQINPLTSLQAGGNSVATGASKILAGQVCMAGIQQALESQRQTLMSQKSSGEGVCSGTPSAAMAPFCNTAVPDFINSVNMVAVQNADPSKNTFTAKMPNFDSNNPYAVLNGICGSITWSSIANINTVSGVVKNNDLETAKMSRAIAIQQMYLDLAMVAQVMVNNNPSLNPSSSGANTNNKPFAPGVAQQQFGVPYLNSGSACDGPSTDCVSWGPDSSNSNAPLFSGTEFQGAITDYNGIMMPTLNLIRQAQDSSNANKQRAFIAQAQQQGWLMAGSYFFDLARLNASDLQTANQTDTNTGLEGSQFDSQIPLNAFSQNKQCSGTYAALCQWLGGNQTAIQNMVGLINGSTLVGPNNPPLSPPTFGNNAAQKAQSGVLSSTVYGFINNSVMVNLPGQPGLNPPQFAMKFNMDLSPGPMYLKSQDFPCGEVKIVFFKFCLGQLLGDIFYNLIIRNLFNFFLTMMSTIINMIVMSFLSLPLLGMAEIFKHGVSFIQQPTVNPVVALANMGVNYINFANELWIYLMGLAIMSAIIPWFGIFIFPLLAMVMPLLFAWLSTMVSIGFLTAYYIPFLPYMIFTFGTIAWLIAVIEAMVAAPIVALGVTHPEGHDAFGKGEQAIMILMNVFLRPAMMIIGYISAIALSYVAVWVINAGFANAVTFVQGDPNAPTWNVTGASDFGKSIIAGAPTGNGSSYQPDQNYAAQKAARIDTTIGYTGWAGIYGFFFAILIYTTMYITAVQKSFTLITYLPDKVLRWIGGQGESIGQETSQWAEEGKKQVEGAGTSTMKAAGQMDQQLQGYAMKGMKKLTGQGASKGASVSGKGGDTGSKAEATPSKMKPPVE
ncbi:DotA [Legionella rubrilucens]|uniref:DotA n=1 Tax=Legionella rubrilucens TaxID=458 RepID=A0A0W0XZF2_9GAMM|nr:type IVB secretion system protein DotA [Legionella rubrilucens]KTD49856.1 DotA [Legionella rubrilucens]